MKDIFFLNLYSDEASTSLKNINLLLTQVIQCDSLFVYISLYSNKLVLF